MNATGSSGGAVPRKDETQKKNSALGVAAKGGFVIEQGLWETLLFFRLKTETLEVTIVVCGVIMIWFRAAYLFIRVNWCFWKWTLRVNLRKLEFGEC